MSPKIAVLIRKSVRAWNESFACQLNLEGNVVVVHLTERLIGTVEITG